MMRYYDKHALTEWNTVFIPASNTRMTPTSKWCKEHDSLGRYCSEWTFSNERRGTAWHFEKQKDAVIFALKFS